MSEPLTLPVLSQQNERVGEISLPADVFSGPVRRHLLYETVKMQMANRRAGTAKTKTRGYVSGGGKKPWRQKGTGRARAGSTRSPLWAGGATLFGPQPRDYSYRMPASARKSALRAALAAKAKEGKLLVLDKIELEAPKTKLMAQLVAGLEIDSALIVIPARDDTIERAARNLPSVKVLRAEGANVYDVLRYDRLILTQDAVQALIGRLAS
ncbi:MAG TPA: 50S ribosomal protein L4 [Candidatus Margulisiibacteriota bacterium]|nr:50S ribosomal protein L4 [Candidatus Margulisiibacteriota bacterium]